MTTPRSRTRTAQPTVHRFQVPCVREIWPVPATAAAQPTAPAAAPRLARPSRKADGRPTTDSHV